MELKLFINSFAMILVIQLSFLSQSCSESIQANNHSDTAELGLHHSADFVESRLSPLTAFDVVSGTIGIADAVLSAFGVGWSFAAPPKYTEGKASVQPCQHEQTKFNSTSCTFR